MNRTSYWILTIGGRKICGEKMAGFEGNGCVAKVAKVTRKLGIQGKMEKKPEYQQHRTSTVTQEIKQNS